MGAPQLHSAALVPPAHAAPDAARPLTLLSPPAGAPTPVDAPRFALSGGAGAASDSSRPAPPTWLTLAALAAAPGLPGATPAARERALRRAAHDLRAAGLARKRNGTWEFHDTARLPGGRCAGDLVRGAQPRVAGRVPPADWPAWNEPDRLRFTDTCTLVDAFDAFVAARRAPRAALAPLFAALPAGATLGAAAAHEPAGTTVAQWCAARGLRCSARSLQRYAPRVTPGPAYDGNVDRRGCARDEGPPFDAAAWELFRAFYLHNNALPLATCHRYVAGEAQRHGWRWCTVAALRRLLRDPHSSYYLPRAAELLARGGPRTLEAQGVPKIARELDEVLAGEVWVLDGRVLDSFVRVPDARTEWRAARPVVTGVLDLRSRRLVLDLRVTECADGILAGLAKALTLWGAPRQIVCDNGEAYKASLGSRLRKGLEHSQERVTRLCANLGIDLAHSIPYHAWAKPIESRWRRLKREFDQFMPSFWGGTPAERPEGRARWLGASVDQLPTIAEAQELLDIWLAEYHARPTRGAGTRGLSPNLLAEHYPAPRRSVAPETIALLCQRLVGPVTVTRDGVTWRGVRYGQTEADVWRLQGQRVWLGLHPDRADQVTLCDQAGTPLATATNAQLRGATQEQVRDAAKRQARYRRIAREQAAAGDYLRKTPVKQILATKRAHAEAEEAALRAQLAPPPDAPPATLVRPDLADAAAKVTRRAAARAARPQHAPAPAADRVSNPARLAIDDSAAPPADAAPLEVPTHAEDILRWLSDVG